MRPSTIWHHKPNPHSLIEADDSVLVVVDVQDAFLGKLADGKASELLTKICWLVQVAFWRHIPLLVTAEEYGEQPLAPQLVRALPPDTPVFDKHVFGLAHQPDILNALSQTNRKTVVLVGLEADVCVLHSAIGLLEQGYRVAAVADGVGAPGPGHELGLARMSNAGATILSTKGLFYEWLRSIEEVNRFHRENADMRGWPGIEL